MIRLIIYDLDGTLIDSGKDISDCVNQSLKEGGFEILPESVIKSYVGHGVVQLMSGVLTKATGRVIDFNDPMAKKSVERYKNYYAQHLLDHTKLYSGVSRVLEFFKTRKQTIITNKPQEFSWQILKGLKVDHYFFTLIGGDQTFQKKPSPESVFEVMKLASAKPEETVFIGDSAIDIQTAKNAHVKVIAVTYGFSSKDELKKHTPDLIVNDLQELTTCPLLV